MYISLKRVIDEVCRLYPQLNEMQHTSNLLRMVHEIQTTATFVPNNVGSNLQQIRVEDDKMCYSEQKRAEIYSKLSLLRDKLFDLQVEVNRQ